MPQLSKVKRKTIRLLPVSDSVQAALMMKHKFSPTGPSAPPFPCVSISPLLSYLLLYYSSHPSSPPTPIFSLKSKLVRLISPSSPLTFFSLALLEVSFNLSLTQLEEKFVLFATSSGMQLVYLSPTDMSIKQICSFCTYFILFVWFLEVTYCSANKNCVCLVL